MTAPRLSHRFGWLALLLTLLLWPRPGYAEQQVYADFDGDGQRDHASFDPSHGSILRIWLSKSQRVGELRTKRPLLQVGAFDLDGDGQPELVATTGRSAGLLVWKAGEGRFKPLRRRHSTRGAAARSTGRKVGDAPSAPDVCAPTNACGDPADLDATPPQLVPTGAGSRRIAAPDWRTDSRLGFDPSSPRAPPVLTA